MAARAAVEALLREKKLDRTLTSALPERLGEDAVAPLGYAPLDRALAGRDGLQNNAVAGGLPRGQVSEVVGPACSGRPTAGWGAGAGAGLGGRGPCFTGAPERGVGRRRCRDAPRRVGSDHRYIRSLRS